METDISDVVVATAMALFGLVGLVLASHAQDDEMYVFGLSLTGFATVFVFGLVKTHFDRVDRKAALELQESAHG